MRRSSEYVQVLLTEARRQAGDAALAGKDILSARVQCFASECVDSGGNGRRFFGLDALRDHAEAVHTFDDIRQMLREVIREKYNKVGDFNASPPVPGTWSWIEDISGDWVAFTVEHGEDSTLFKADYSITDDVITLGDPVQVVRRTVYDPV